MINIRLNYTLPIILYLILYLYNFIIIEYIKKIHFCWYINFQVVVKKSLKQNDIQYFFIYENSFLEIYSAKK